MKKIKTAKKTAKERKWPAVSPGKTAVNIYMDSSLHEEIKQRAKSLNIPVARYFQQIARRDLQQGGAFLLTPDKGQDGAPPAGSEPKNTGA